MRFEKENINSLSGDGELMLSILASFAQEESRSISENVKWGTIKRFKQGIPNGKFSIFGYEWQDDKLVIIRLHSISGTATPSPETSWISGTALLGPRNGEEKPENP